jgi:ParB-like chromosome segregation protein Spo0J
VTGPVVVAPDLAPLLVPMDSITPAERNAHRGDIELIAESIRTNGFAVPLVVRRDTRTIVAGNHRYAALQLLGVSHVPVVLVDMDDTAAARFAIADNRSSQVGTDDLALLTEILTELASTELGLDGTGYDDDDLVDLRELLEPSMANPYPMRELEDEPDARQAGGWGVTCPNCGHTFGGKG